MLLECFHDLDSGIFAIRGAIQQVEKEVIARCDQLLHLLDRTLALVKHVQVPVILGQERTGIAWPIAFGHAFLDTIEVLVGQEADAHVCDDNAMQGYNKRMTTRLVAALYRFVSLPDYRELREPLLERCRDLEIRGTLLLASEGINGTIAGKDEAIHALLDYLRSEERFADLEVKFSKASISPFHRMKVRLKKEIVTMGIEGIDPNRVVGTYVEPEEWNSLIEQEDVWVVDTRNDYEVGIGTFRGATDPDIRSFREFPAWIRAQRERRKEPKVAMFCTGGIRCEKSTAFLKEEGVEEVFHLKGGILKYLERVPEEESLWEGECFVFDERVAVGQGLKEGSYGLCRACRFPISEEDRAAPEYVEGVSCPRCESKTTAAQKAGFAERHKQMLLAEARGSHHLSDG